MSATASPTPLKPFSFVVYPKTMGWWLSVLCAVILYLLPTAWLTDKQVATIWVCVLFGNWLAVELDFDTWTMFTLLIGVLVLVLGVWILASEYHIHLMEPIQKLLKAIDLKISRDTILTFGILQLAILCCIWIYCQLCCRYVVLPGKIERRILGKMETQFQISAARPVTYVIDDVMDCVLFFGGGYLIVRDENNQPKKLGIVFGPVWSLDEKIDKYEVVAVTTS